MNKRLLGSNPKIKQPEGIERKNAIIGILKRKLLNQIIRNLKGISLNEIDENISPLYDLPPHDMISSLQKLIAQDFAKMRSIKKRNTVINDLLTVFTLASQEIELDSYETNLDISLDQEANRVNKKVRDILN